MSRNGEVWRPVLDWPYAVSNHGRVRRTAPRSGTSQLRLLSPYDRQGYLSVRLFDRGRNWNITVHLLVAQAFLGDPPGPTGCGTFDYQVDHIDDNKKNNHVSNLRWVASHRNKKLAGNSTLTPDDVRAIRRRYAAGGISQRALAAEYDVSQGTVWSIIRRKIWSGA